jgi:voltage-gated potassium channel
MASIDGPDDDAANVEPLPRHELVDGVLTLVLLGILMWEAAVHPGRPEPVQVIHWALFVGFLGLALYRWFGPPRQREPFSLAFEAVMLVLAFPPLVVATGPFRLLRLVRLPLAGVRGVRSLRRALVTRGVVVLALASTMSAVVGALAVLEFERSHQIATVPDALWWAATTMTTVGYGDLAPATLGGRLVALVLMIVGIAAFGMTTALLARWFMDLSGAAEEQQELHDLRREVQALRADLALEERSPA